MKTLGEQLKEENEAKRAERLKAERERQALEIAAAKKAAKIIFDGMIEDLPDKIKKANKDGYRSMNLIEAGYNPGKFQFTRTEWELMWLLKDWANRNGFKYSARPYRAYEGGEDPQKFWISWE